MSKDLIIRINLEAKNALNNLKIVKDNISKIGDGAKDSSGKLATLEKGLKGSFNDLKILGSVAIKANALLLGIGANAVRLSSEFENLNNRLMTLIAAADKRDLSDALKIEGAKDKAKGLIGELRKLDETLAFTLNDLTEMLASFYSSASQNMSFDEAVNAFKAVAYAAQASGADVNSLKMTLDSLGAGVADTASDFGRFANNLGLSTARLRRR